jgi:voltage-gated potassium channel
MYLVEYHHNESFSSIPKVYWSIVTLTTVGYGDITPVSTLGKILASFIMILGYSIIAAPTGIIGKYYSRNEKA